MLAVHEVRFRYAIHRHHFTFLKIDFLACLSSWLR